MWSLEGEHWALQEGKKQIHLLLEGGENLTKEISPTFCVRDMGTDHFELLDLFDLQDPNTSSQKIPVTQRTFVPFPQLLGPWTAGAQVHFVTLEQIPFDHKAFS